MEALTFVVGLAVGIAVTYSRMKNKEDRPTRKWLQKGLGYLYGDKVVSGFLVSVAKGAGWSFGILAGIVLFALIIAWIFGFLQPGTFTPATQGVHA